MLRVWKWYQNCLAVHPVKTQMISSGVLWGLGDIGAQAVTHHASSNKKRPLPADADGKDKEFKINWKRVGITSMYEYLDRVIRYRFHLQPKSVKFVAAKLTADGLLFGPWDLLIFFSYMGFASGRSVEQVKEDVKRDFVPALILGGGVWPIVQIANFRFVPVRYQLLYVNFFCLLDSAFLSWIEQQGDASWKQWFSSFRALEKQKNNPDI
ncbi:Protein Mpv17 [Ananas comosus]|uniref:Protein Mpv17 n=1 Tax=Ananas comosus TaxID=4615 RepID=A0A199VME8_ANACO|nr:Protein Mpv17 [Ananas comosus]OAY78367.1 Protein Mpv17 [Ananas comosus]